MGRFRVGLGNCVHHWGMCLAIIVIWGYVRSVNSEARIRCFPLINLPAYRVPGIFELAANSELS